VKEVQKVWLVRAAHVFLPLVLAAGGIAVAIHFNNSDEHWVAALFGWTTGWFFALFAIARWEVSFGRPAFGQEGPEQPSWQRAEVIALAVILLAATLLRVVGIEHYPIRLHNDEMSCLIEARKFLGTETALFNLGWYDCPNFGFFLTSLPIRLLGPTLSALRLSSAFLGLMSLIAVYLLVRRLFGVRPAILLLLLTTPFHWHLHYSRAGFHYMQAASLTAVAVLLFAVAFDRRSPVIFGCAGVVTGIAWQTYYAAWLIPLILTAWALARLISDRRQWKTAVTGSVVTMSLFAVTLAPVLVYYTERPAGATARPNAVYLLSPENQKHVIHSYGTADPGELLMINAKRLCELFIGELGDEAQQYALHDQFIDPYLMPLFLAGLAYSLVLLLRPGGQLLWIWFLGTMISGGLLTIDAPFSPRLIGITPIILLFPVLLIDRVLRVRWIVERKWVKIAATAVICAVVVLSTWWNLHTTFVRYPASSSSDNRDFIIRLATDLGNVRAIVNFNDPERFEHRAYLSLLPGVRKRNITRGQEAVTNHVAVIKAFRPQVLVIVPLADNEFYGFCDRIGGDPGGIVITGQGATGFEWCFVE